MEIAFIVDDNLIGNKRAIKPLLAAVAAWQRRHGYPLTFFTEASIDLAEDPELLQLMVDANVASVFVGIETPNEDSLRETKKLQNVRPGVTLVERIHAIQAAGVEVWCGMILGFDHDDMSVFAAQQQLVRDARVVHAMIGMLAAIPKTPLHARLAAEGRLDENDETEFGTNVVPALMTRAELRDGYMRVLRELYAPEAYFGRLEQLYLRDDFQFSQTRTAYWHRHPWTWLTAELRHLTWCAALYWQLMRGVSDATLRREYRRRLARFFRVRRDPAVLFVYLVKCLAHYHYHTMIQNMSADESQVVNTF
jgi:radical SAM superfamily enzyme YgiQ (UPF0313 family)